MRQRQHLITPWSAEVGVAVLTIWAVCISSLLSFLREFSSLSFSRSISFSCLSSCCTRSWKFTTCFHSVWTLLLNHNSGAVYLGHLAGRSKPATIYNFVFFKKRHFGTQLSVCRCSFVDWASLRLRRYANHASTLQVNEWAREGSAQSATPGNDKWFYFFSKCAAYSGKCETTSLWPSHNPSLHRCGTLYHLRQTVRSLHSDVFFSPLRNCNQCGAFRGVPAVGTCSKLQKLAQYNLNSLWPLWFSHVWLWTRLRTVIHSPSSFFDKISKSDFYKTDI